MNTSQKLSQACLAAISAAVLASPLTLAADQPASCARIDLAPSGAPTHIDQQAGTSLQFNQQPSNKNFQITCQNQSLGQQQAAVVAPAPAPVASAPAVESSRQHQEAGSVASSAAGTSTTREESSQHDHGLRGEVLGIKPQVGAVRFHDQSGASDTRGVAGATLDLNFTPGAPFFVGPSTGFLFSRIGGQDANFFGSGGNQVSGTSANFFQIPADLKIAWNPANFRIGVHGGGNVIHRSVTSTVALGTNPDQSSDSSWKVFPNAGADLEMGLGSHSALLVRPDVTFGGDNPAYSGTVGLSIMIG